MMMMSSYNEKTMITSVNDGSYGSICEGKDIGGCNGDGEMMDEFILHKYFINKKNYIKFIFKKFRMFGK